MFCSSYPLIGSSCVCISMQVCVTEMMFYIPSRKESFKRDKWRSLWPQMLIVEKWHCPSQCLWHTAELPLGVGERKSGEGEAGLCREGAQPKMSKGCSSFALESHWVRSGHTGLSSEV